MLSGTFADEGGRVSDRAPTSRNPPGSRHRPFSTSGCELFVKLRQFHPEDQIARRDPHAASPVWHPGLVPGLTVLPLARACHRACRTGPLGARNPLSGAHPLGRRGDPGPRRHVQRRVLATTPAGTWIRSPAPEPPSALQRTRVPDLREGRATWPRCSRNSQDRSRVATIAGAATLPIPFSVSRELFRFDSATSVTDWYAIDDAVMGGISRKPPAARRRRPRRVRGGRLAGQPRRLRLGAVAPARPRRRREPLAISSKSVATASGTSSTSAPTMPSMA